MCSLLISMAAIVAASSYVDSARIIGLFPHIGKSHYMVFQPLLIKLAERGHQVTVASFFPLKNPPTNYVDINLESAGPIGVEVLDTAIYENSNTALERIIVQVNAFMLLDVWALDVCNQLVSSPTLKDALTKDYDLVIVENFSSDCMLGLAYVYGVRAPVIALSSTGMMPWSAERIGVNDNPSYVPLIALASTTTMNFFERFENTILQIYYKYWFRTNIQLKEQEIIEKHFGKKIPDLQNMAKNISLLMTNTHYTLQGVRPSIPGLIEVGGIHLDHSERPIPHVSTSRIY